MNTQQQKKDAQSAKIKPTRNKKPHLAVEDVHVPPEVLGHDPPAELRRLLRHVGHLQQHGAREVAAFQQVEVDVHVVRSLPSPLRLLLLGVLVLFLFRFVFFGGFVSSHGRICLHRVPAARPPIMTRWL